MAKSPAQNESSFLLSADVFFKKIGEQKVDSFKPTSGPTGKSPVAKFIDALEVQVELLKKWDGKAEVDGKTSWFRPDPTKINAIRLKWGRQPITINGTQFIVVDSKAEAILILESLKKIIMGDGVDVQGDEKIQQAIIDQANNRSAALSAAKRKK
ncbi:hypothetical protein G6M86_21025 [Agrobacterium tumefaciens]|uniref:Uncharacterized protein n=1 Tax=Agrobacterium tumefaciens TaxID=358 RepID=A0AAJ4N6R6_AGRTU|nr:hypothetical protein G6M86_21025 [Agrobacterium tumefaciens]